MSTGLSRRHFIGAGTAVVAAATLAGSPSIAGACNRSD